MNDDPLENVEQNEGPDEAADAGAANEIDALRTERDELFARLARLQADFINARKRLEADKEQAVQFANSKLIRNLLPVIDNFERALAVEPDKMDAVSLLKGMQIVHDQWLAVLGQEQVEPIAPKAGEPFDPQKMQAITQQPSDQYDEPAVTQLFQKGYLLHGRTLRPAQVAVSKAE